MGLSCGRVQGFGRREGESGSGAEAGEEGGVPASGSEVSRAATAAARDRTLASGISEQK